MRWWYVVLLPLVVVDAAPSSVVRRPSSVVPRPSSFVRSPHPTTWGAPVDLAVYEARGNGTRGGLLLVPGFQDPVALKYPEILASLVDRGYDPVVMYDHRGQGASTRLLRDDAYKGHVDDWTHYVDDLRAVASTHVDARFLACHSMGGAICLDALTSGPPLDFEAFVAVAPMVRPLTPPFPYALAQALGKALVLLGEGEAYPPSKGAEPDDVWSADVLPTWTANATFWRGVVRRADAAPHLRTGDADASLALATLHVHERLFDAPRRLTIPTLFQLAGDDRWVDNGWTLQYALARVDDPTIVHCTEAKHFLWPTGCSREGLDAWFSRGVG